MNTNDNLFFIASIVNTNEEYGVFTLGLANEDGSNQNVLIQYQSELSEEDISQGFSKYHLSIGPNDLGNYNVIEKVVLRERRLEIDLNKDGQSLFMISSISIVCPEKTYIEIVKPAIHKIFGYFPVTTFSL